MVCRNCSRLVTPCSAEECRVTRCTGFVHVRRGQHVCHDDEGYPNVLIGVATPDPEVRRG